MLIKKRILKYSFLEYHTEKCENIHAVSTFALGEYAVSSKVAGISGANPRV